jgi:1-aminocyclopropane-1-carboxylate deaminase
LNPFEREITTLHVDGAAIDVLRLDKIHLITGGNKYFKLRYNLTNAAELGYKSILTFGGAHSNHIAATAQACLEAGLGSTGFIRGKASETPTLLHARQAGMRFVFLDYAEYKNIHETGFIQDLQHRYPDHYILPEGGNNRAGIKGCTEILSGLAYNHVFCACGTGTTYAGLVCAAGEANITGINVLKGNNSLAGEVKRMINAVTGCEPDIKGNLPPGNLLMHHSITDTYAFSGYACFDKRLIAFKTEFEQKYGIQLDHIYTVKLFYAVFDLVKAGVFASALKPLIVHSGGLQGNAAFERRYSAQLAAFGVLL